MTFRFEALRECSEQRWADRLDSAYQTGKALRLWERNVQAALAAEQRQFPQVVSVYREQIERHEEGPLPPEQQVLEVARPIGVEAANFPRRGWRCVRARGGRFPPRAAART
jgi:hypothetical protein